MILFGSCNHQKYPQHFWSYIKENFNPSHFLFLGDSVYAKTGSIASLRDAYEQLTAQNSNFSKFRTHVKIDGVWDDHDYGVNDGGRYIDAKSLRMKMFKDYILDDEVLLPQDGVYHSELFRIANRTIKIIYLDTRSFRDDHIIKSFGELHFPFSALISAAIRGISALFGTEIDYKGDVLGEAQWKWLEAELFNDISSVDFHIIVSSIQVLTTNAVLESWGHFPFAKRRLFDVVKAANPRSLSFLSGKSLFMHYFVFSNLKYF
jgi:alkaline phosphatase D